MNIKILGTRGEIKESAPYHRNKSGVLINNYLLLDWGEYKYIKYQPRAIFITHLHPDHAYFIRHHEQPLFTGEIYAPENYDSGKIKILNKKIILDNYIITPIPTIHSAKVKSQAYLVEHDQKKILYTGDLIWIEKKFHHLIGQVDLIITEASYQRAGGLIRKHALSNKLFGHNGVSDLIKLLKKFSNNFLFVHFGAWFFKDIKKARQYFKTLAQENTVSVIVGYDGQEIEI